jgi:ribosomal protein S18 acetylase RimI-like enzyme
MLRAFLHEPGVFCRVAEETADAQASQNAGPQDDTQAEPQAKTMLGFLIAQQERRTGHIITLDVPAAHRRKGIGSMLVRDAEERMARAGVREVELEVAVDNAAGVAFWKKHGYCTCGVLARYYAGRTDALHMIKILSLSKQ